jgi:hypothetical protein
MVDQRTTKECFKKVVGHRASPPRPRHQGPPVFLGCGRRTSCDSGDTAPDQCHRDQRACEHTLFATSHFLSGKKEGCPTLGSSTAANREFEKHSPWARHMRHVPMLTAMLFALIVAAACGDGPMTPDSAPTSAAVAPSRDYLLDPVIVIGTPQTPAPACDPYTDINFCQGQDDQCMTGISPALGDFMPITGCPGMVGGGSGGPGGDDSPLPGDTNNNGTTEDEGPGVWILCISSVLGVVVGGGVSYFAVEDYFYKLSCAPSGTLSST